MRSLSALALGMLLPLALAAPAPAPAQVPAQVRAPVQTPSLVQYDVRDLPLVELPPIAGATGAASDALVVLVTGDGDWADLDKGVSEALRRAGAGVVGLKSRSYLQQGSRTPGGLTSDVERIVRHYAPLWGRNRIVLVGYSRGAEFVPFVANRLPPDLRARVALVTMFGLSRAANFTFHWSDLVRDQSRPSDLPVAPELAQLRGTRMLCVYGDDEKDSGCRDGDASLMQRVERTGGHHLGGDYAGLGALIVDALAAR
ncbi:MAG: hypothetical protein JO180_06115 [Gemmatirosa sp.]|nr:hypothetical protein [Gemmatirosa sp.]